MTPRPQTTPLTYTPTLTDGDMIQNHDTSQDQEEETRPTHTAEIGTLKKLDVPGGTAWLGSSSGVYFVNTVRRAFSAAFAAQSPDADGNVDDDTLPASEDIIIGEDASGRNVNGGITSTSTSIKSTRLLDEDFHRRIFASVGRPPADQKLTMDLVTTFFRQTHPLFPFLHGPQFLKDMDEIYAALNGARQSQNSNTSQIHKGQKAPSNRRANSMTSSTSNLSIPNIGNLHSIEPLKLITFQIIINIAAHSHPASSTSTSALPPGSIIHSAQALLTLILPLCTTPLLPTIQLLLAAELYLLSTISLRHASTLGGIVLRLIFHTGLHRCPLRYAALTDQDCEIRKRIFWSAYAMDRHLSLALGDPNTFQDSDIDVCLSRNGGESELHRAVARDLLSDEEKQSEMKLHFPRDIAGNIVLGDINSRDRTKSNTNTADVSDSSKEKHEETQHRVSSINPDEPSARMKQLREAALTAYVQYGKLTGRIIEIFHKSINHRFPKEDAIGFLTADIENWWNDLPSTLTGDFNSTTTSDKTDGLDAGLVEQHRMLTPFFTLLYHQLLLLLNRPRLSLDQASAEFQQGLQVCIRASRSTLSALKKHKENKQSMFLPGLLSAAWMSGLIIAFACQLGKYPKSRAVGDIKSCLTIIESMHMKWYTVKNCHKVLSLLLVNITSRRASTTGYLAAGRSEQATSQPTRKRTIDTMSVDPGETEPSPKRESLSGVSPASSDFKSPPVRSPESRIRANAQRSAATGMSLPSFTHQDSTISNSSMDFSMNPGQNFQGFNLNTFPAPSNPDGIDQTMSNQQRAGAAIYADPQDMAFAQSSHSMGLPELSSGDDQMFWGNMDSNLFDVFGAVSWETMTGPVGPMANAYDISAFANVGNGNDTMGYVNQRYSSS